MSKQPAEKTLFLVERAQGDDPDALQLLFTRFLPRVRNIAAIRLGRNPRELFDVDDIAQEAITDAFLALEKFDIGSDGAICNWLSTLVENRIRMALRAGRAQRRGGGKVQRFADVDDTVRSSQFAGDAVSPSQHAAGNELNDKLQSVLHGMTEQFREVLLQRVFCRMTYAEIADTMGMPNADAVRGVYAKALKALQAGLGTDAARATRGWG